MRMSGERRISAAREIVWAALNDADVLRRSLPGCDILEARDDGALVGTVTAAVGPVRARFTGTVRLSDIDPPHGWRITGESQGGPAGFANGSATVALVADGDGTVIRYDVEATVGGKLAQIGSRLVDAAARKMADDFFAEFGRIVFFAEFGRIVAAGSPRDLEPTILAKAASEAAARQGLSPLVWVPTLIVMVAFFALLFA